MKNKIFLLILIFLLLPSLAQALGETFYTNLFDDWDWDTGTNYDNDIWPNYGTKIEIRGDDWYSEDGDAVCLDFDTRDNNGPDYCFYDGTDKECDAVSTYFSQGCNKNCQGNYLGQDLVITSSLDRTGYDHIFVRLYHNCNGGSNRYWWEDSEEYYYNWDRRRNRCDYQESNKFYNDARYTENNNWYWWSENYCSQIHSSKFACDSYAEVSSSEAETAMSDPCKLKNGEYDCDADSDCFYGSHCSQTSGWDYCCPNGQEWINGACRVPCTEGASTGSKRCSGNTVQEERYHRDCTTYWADVENCNGRDNYGSWEFYCPDADNVKKKRLFNDYSCTSGECSNDPRYVNDQVVSQNGNWEYCSLRRDKSCSLCANTKYDCDADNECNSNNCACTGLGGCGAISDVAGLDYCCPQGSEWINSQCCGDNDNDGYYSSSCGGNDCNDTNANIRPGAAEVCNGVDDDCDSSVDEGGVCNCHLTGASWNVTSTAQGDNVGLIVQGDVNCNARTIGFVVWEADEGLSEWPNGDDAVQHNPSSAIFTSGSARTTWIAEWQQDGAFGVWNPPEYKFIANSDTSVTSTNRLTVNKLCQDSDNDDYYRQSSCGSAVDCDDTDASIHPGATEVCNSKDDDCDNSIDENLVRSCGSDVGECRYGTQTCANGNWGSCVGSVNLTSEVCDGRDNDCDGSVDEGLLQLRSCGVGICAGGSQEKRCTNGRWGDWLECSTAHLARPEQCNNLDDDCDGSTDENNVCCDVPDGGNADCECDSNADCPSGYKCQQNPVGWDACVVDSCTNDCNAFGAYHCISNNVYVCGNTDDDSCYEWGLHRICGYNYVCSEGNSQCSQVVKNVNVFVEDAKDGNVVVYKQPGDKVKVKIVSDRNQQVAFDAPDSFTGNCADGNINVKTGSNYCEFDVPETAFGSYFFRAEGKTARIRVISNPKTLIVTHKGKLLDRFYGDEAGVNNLLSDAYQKASQDQNTIIYDLGEYLTGHLFEGYTYSTYTESPLNPNFVDNTYSYSVAKFIAEKCNGCSNTIILGDDYVVPFNRVDYFYLHSWFEFWVRDHTELNYLYTDQPYITENTKKIGDIEELFDNTKVRNIKIVLPKTASQALSTNISNLKGTIAGYGYNDITEYDWDEVGCNSYSALGDATLILIGNRNDNYAIKCVPWFDIGEQENDNFESSVSIERNVWGQNKYAIVISGSRLDQGVYHLNDILQNPAFYLNTFLKDTKTAYIHEFSAPPDLPLNSGTVITGMLLGTCDEEMGEAQGACIVTDFIASMAPPTDIITDIRDTALYCPTYAWDKITGKNTSVFDGLACGASGAGVLTTVGAYTVVGAVPGKAGDVATTGIKRVVKSVKNIFKSTADDVLKLLGDLKVFKHDGFFKFMKADWHEAGKIGEGISKVNKANKLYKLEWNKLTKYFASDELASVIKNVDEYEQVGKGTKKTLSYVKNIDDIAPGTTKVAKADFVKNVGKMSEEVADDVAHVADVKGADKLAENIVKQGGGFPFEAKTAKKLRETGENLLELGKRIPDGEIDVISRKSGKVIATEVKSGKVVLNDIRPQLNKLKEFVDGGNADKARLISKNSVPQNVKDYAQALGIEIIEGGV